ncbi:MAG: hypothetical protein D6814_00490 [Calditrichaeota bacterium]|nr:MAG: hypothetical protein D6814_00490 [Calditrichota bacterium]
MRTRTFPGNKNRKGLLMRSLILCLFLSLPAALFAVDISGTVVDERTGEPLVGANVFIENTNVGTATNANGKFFISYTPQGNFNLIVSFIGYKRYSKTFGPGSSTTNLTIKLREDVFQTEAIVVTGIANRRSKAVAEVSVDRVSAESLTETNNYTTLDQLVNGKLAGVQVRASSGNVGAGFRFFVRSGGGLNGNEQPVIYVDGVRVDNAQLRPFFTGGQGLSTLANLNPDEIANIEVLKGPAAAASYGTNGSNGVVLITTKRGRISPGQRAEVHVNYKFTAGSSEQAYKYKKEDFVSADDANAAFVDGSLTQHNVDVSGGNQFLKYFTSYEHRNEDGIMLNNSQTRDNLRANFDIFPSKYLNFSITTGYANSQSSVPQNDNNTRGWLGNTLLFARSYRFTDSLSIAKLLNSSRDNRFIGSFQATWTPIKQFQGKFSIGLDNSDLRWDETLRSDLFYNGVNNGRRQAWVRNNHQITVDLNARYTYHIGSSITATSIVGTQIFNRRNRTAFVGVENFSTPLITDLGAGADVQQKGESKFHSRQAGVFTTHQFTVNNRYFVTLGLRRDYASAIGKNAPSVFYPQASGAVRLDQFNILPATFSLFKLRVAYGETGILPNLTDGVPILWGAESGGYGAGAVPSGLGNVEIKPERVREIEIGFDAEFLRNYSLEFTYYLQRARDSIIGFVNAPSTGKVASTIPINIGQINGSGIETLLQASPFRSRNFGVDISLTNSYQTNEVKDLGGAQPIFDGFDVNVTKEGLRNHEFFQKKVIGAKFNDDGTYAGPELTADRVPLGNPIPSYTGSFSINIHLFRNFNIYALADWATGNKVYNNTKRFAVRFGNNPEYNRLRYQLGLTNTKPAGEDNLTQLTPGSQEYIDAANRIAHLDGNIQSNFIEDADYLKLREISVNYNLMDLVRRLNGTNYVKNLIVGFSARNLYTTTKYSGPDPEINFAGARSLSRGQDFLTLQNPRTFNFFVQIGL